MSEQPWISVQVPAEMVRYLEVAGFHSGIRSRSEYLRTLITADMEAHPKWVKQARERTHADA